MMMSGIDGLHFQNKYYFGLLIGIKVEFKIRFKFMYKIYLIKKEIYNI